MEQSRTTPNQPGNPDPTHELPQLLSALAQAMTGLAQSQQAVLQALQAQPRTESVAPGKLPPPADVGGETLGGVGPGGIVDYSKLSPVQQITLGLRSAPPAQAGRPADKT